MRKKTPQLNFRETFDYIHCTLLGVEGVFLPMLVSLECLPEHIFPYYIQKDRRGNFYSCSVEYVRNSCGIFFGREQISLPNPLTYFTSSTEFQQGIPFREREEFYQFFGVRLTLDKQISLADEKADEEESDEDDSAIYRELGTKVTG